MRSAILMCLAALLAAACAGSDASIVVDTGNEPLVDAAVPEDLVSEVLLPDLAVELPPVAPDIGEDVFPGFDSWDQVDFGIPPGAAGYPCQTGDDCASGFCIQTPAGKQCTMDCIEECPFDWVCVQHQPSLPDEIFICAPLRMNLCKPCEKNSDCLTNGAETGDACLPYGPDGNFCGSSCMGTEDCPGGYECKNVLDIWGYESNQCVLTAGECDCEPWFVDEGAKTACVSANDFGECEGERFCTMEGLTECTAPEPIKEACNGNDDDCDGDVDENAGGDTCFVENEWGACKGAYSCVAGQLSCDAAEPAAEICDGKDNDCDGQNDEGFPDSDLDGLADCLENDIDGDGVLDIDDNCEKVENPDQLDSDLDMAGDACDPDDDNDQVADGLDCAPLDSDVYPGADEECNGVDDDCNGMVDEGFNDNDFDSLKDCVDDDDDNDGFADSEDCAPLDADVHVGASEECDGIDNDCDFETDEGFPDTDLDGLKDCVDVDIDGDKWDNDEDNCPFDDNLTQEDQDGDGVGDVCDPDVDGDGIAQLLDNCPDTFNPGQKDLDGDGDGDECDGDVDGDGVNDGADNCPLVPNTPQVDSDDDGAGDACDDDQDGDGDPDATDCEPLNPYVNSDAEEECDGLDNNCNGIPDEGFSDTDFDGLKNCIDPDDDDDGDTDASDCAPLDPAIHVGADEKCNGVDDDCDDQVDEDTGSLACGLGLCFHTVAGCIDGVEQQCNPFEGQAAEVCDGQDNDCDGSVDEELGWSTCGQGVCVHMEPNCFEGENNACDPLAGAGEEICDGADNDCNGKVDEDLGTSSCGLGVCEHQVANCIGGIPQICDPEDGVDLEKCDGLDNDCDGEADEGFADLDEDGVPDCIDVDDDGDGDPDFSDCSPYDGEIHHAAVEVCDGVDNNCVGGSDEENALGCEPYYQDKDQDGHGMIGGGEKCLCAASGLNQALVDDDCNDLNPWVFPGATELCDGVDNNCDDVVDEMAPPGARGSLPIRMVTGMAAGTPTVSALLRGPAGRC